MRLHPCDCHRRRKAGVISMNETDRIASEPEYASQTDVCFEDKEEQYFLAMTNDCADPDDGTARTHEQVQEDWKLLGIVR